MCMSSWTDTVWSMPGSLGSSSSEPSPTMTGGPQFSELRFGGNSCCLQPLLRRIASPRHPARPAHSHPAHRQLESAITMGPDRFFCILRSSFLSEALLELFVSIRKVVNVFDNCVHKGL